MDKHPVILIVGSDSVVGRALMAYLQEAGDRVVGTTKRRESVDELHLYLDLSEDVEGWRCPWPVAVAVVCAGVTKLDACWRDPVATARVNVQNVPALVKNLVATGTFVIYLSSNQVFDGSVPHRLPDDPVSPATEYGRQKAEAERQISQWGDSAAIVRLTKIIELPFPLFSRWADSLEKEEVISPFVDMSMAPVPLNGAISILRIVADLRLPGILQVSGNEDISYAEAAGIGARLLGLDLGLVKPITVSEFGSYMETVPANTTLNIDRLKYVLGVVPPDVRWTIKRAFKNL